MSKSTESQSENDTTETPLIIAAQTSNVNQLTSLLSNPSTDKNLLSTEQLSSALLEAVTCSTLEQETLQCVRSLLDRGADPNVVGPLGSALDSGGKWRTRTLRAKEAFVRPYDLRARRHEDYVKLAKLLIDYGADLNAKDDRGETIVHLAAFQGDDDVLSTITDGSLGAKADLFATRKDGRTALHMAAASWYALDALELLLKCGLDPNKSDTSGLSPLCVAAMNESGPPTARLLSAGADPNHNAGEAHHEMTPLHFATAHGACDVVSLLLDHPDTNPSLRDTRGQTASLYSLDWKTYCHCHSDQDLACVFALARIKKSKLSTLAEDVCLRSDFASHEFGPEGSSLERYESIRSVHELLYSKYEFGQTREPDYSTIPKHNGGFEWIRLPANNMGWLQALIDRTWLERGCRNYKAYARLVHCLDQGNVWLPGEDTRRQLEPGYHALDKDPQPPHIESMSDSQESMGEQPQAHSKEAPQNDSSLLQKDSDTTGVAIRHPGTFYAIPPHARDERKAQYDHPEKVSFGQGVSTRQALNRDALKAYIHHTEPLHLKRTVREFFYSGFETGLTEKQLDELGIGAVEVGPVGHGLALIVDQLWLFIFDNDLIITCFPDLWEGSFGGRRTGSGNPPDLHLDIQEFLEEHIPKTISALALIIAAHCANAVDRYDYTGHSLRFSHYFDGHLMALAAQESTLFARFRITSHEARLWLDRYQNARKNRLPTMKLQKDQAILDDLLDTEQEMKMLTRLKDLQEEIGIIQTLIDKQLALLEDLKKKSLEATEEAPRGKAAFPAILPKSEAVIAELKRLHSEISHQMDWRKRDLDRMDGRAKTLQNNLTSLLDLEHMQSNMLEAKASRDQAVLAAQQGSIVLVFTVVTIIFLPLSFIATIFTINFEEWKATRDDTDETRLTFPVVFKYVFGIGVAVSVPLVIMALFVDTAKAGYLNVSLSMNRFSEPRRRKSLDEEDGKPEVHADDTAPSPPSVGVKVQTRITSKERHS
ncbi:hypothetical protein QBC35DRAFT_454818 [Podospora australis]|uniref:Ankyrin repeat protein n=1 Tax=Podospora australis TaxID=1536484 RepID=A0AAN7AF38_9PEZI|nr:hypothetical protein QBC35DRAFT_454818 [Podospora australis]